MGDNTQLLPLFCFRYIKMPMTTISVKNRTTPVTIGNELSPTNKQKVISLFQITDTLINLLVFNFLWNLPTTLTIKGWNVSLRGVSYIETSPWTIVGNVFRECHVLCTINISFVDFNKELEDCNHYKKLKLSSLLNSSYFLQRQYISLSWYVIPEVVVHIRISLIEGCC